MRVYDKIYINGSWVSSSSSETHDVINSSTEEVMATIPEGTAADVDKAVAAAKAAFPAWAATSRDERAKYLQRLSEGLNARLEEIAASVTDEVGTIKFMSQIAQAGLPAAMAHSFVEIAQTYAFEEQVGSSLVVHEPIGVVACITPWNYPLHQVVAKIAPAFAAGCTVVLKPSEVAPITAFILAEILDEIDLPAGVFNLVSGHGTTVGEALVTHPDVAKVSFTGSTRAGKRIMALASEHVKKVTLELGGKSPFIILDDSPVDEAVNAGFQSAYMNGGQTCIAWTRMLVPASRKDEFVAKAKEVAESYAPCDPTGDTFVGVGPMASKVQQERVRAYIQKGIDEGATLVTGGVEQPEEFEKGFYIKPTVFADVTNDMTIAREEIFGPVLSIITYEDEDDAVRIANDTLYGLSAGVYSADKDRALRVARRIDSGLVDINGPQFNLAAPFGGYKESGLGREYGTFGLAEFLETKSIQIPG
ncbi:MAG: aldehyde dehydrogenase family protein [Actinobacteria bacterium]|nr:aldehyde dehydrogenase family protein [Actinomycetota bacterium]